MISFEGDKQIREICHDIDVQIGSSTPPAIILQIYVPSEDLLILETYKKQIVLDFLEHGTDSPYSHAAAYLMTYVAFEYYDSAYWKHLSEYISYNLPSNIQQSLGMNYSNYAEYYGFHVVSEGNRYVGTLLFNAGIPKHYATSFFDKVRSLYMRVHGDLSDDSLHYLKTEVGDIGASYASAGGQAKGVRQFMADLDYSSDLWKKALTRIDQMSTSSDDHILIDMGALETSFNEWSCKPESKVTTSCKTIETGLYLNTKVVIPYIHISENVVDNRGPQLSINGGAPVGISVKTVNGQYETIPYDHNLDEEAIFSGLSISLDGIQIFNSSYSKYIIFNSSGRVTQNLSKGTNYVLCDLDQEIESYSYLNYFGDYAIYTLEGLEHGNVISICGDEVPVGFKQSHNVEWVVDKIDLNVKRNSEHILCLRNHPKINIDSDMSECLLYVFNSSELILKTRIIHKDYTEYDTAALLPVIGGYYHIVIRFGSIKFSTSYVLISDFDIKASDLITASSSVITLTLLGKTVEIPVSSDDMYHEFDLVGDDHYTMRLRTNIVGYSFDHSPILKKTGSVIDRHELKDFICISTGMMNDGILELNVFSKGIKLTGTRYLRIKDGEAKYSLGNLMYSLRNVFDEMTFEIKTNDVAIKLFTIREVFGIDIDYDESGICLLTSRHTPFGRRAIVTGTIDDEPFEFEMNSGKIKDILYSRNLEFSIIDSKSGKTIRGPIIFSNHGRKCSAEHKTPREYALQKDYEGAFCEAKWKIRKGQYGRAIPYLEYCIQNHYSPSYELYAFCMLNEYKDSKRYEEYLDKASKNGCKRSKLLKDLIEQFNF